MASASVPPPPQDDSLLDPLIFSQHGSYDDYSSIEQQHTSRYFAAKRQHSTTHSTSAPTNIWGAPGDGFVGCFSNSSEPVQRVPYTPSLQHSTDRGDYNNMTSHQLMTAERRLNFSLETPEESSCQGNITLRPITEIPEKYRSVFKEFTFFNHVQSKVFDDVLYTDLPLVTSAPTGSGKTVIFELAIVRLLQQIGQQISSVKIVYVAPMKALCSERFTDWQAKFGPLGLKCCELTGDSQLDDYFELQSAQIVMTTPEKWDSMTRKWRDHKSLVQLVRLFLIDEVHQLNDDVRGPTVEAIVSRMKTIRAATDHGGTEGGRGREGAVRGRGAGGLRLIAVSATIPNITDLCSWLGSEECPALEYKIDECHRPVRLRKVVLSYPSSSSDFKFNLSLNYRISGVIHTYSDQKPTLVFCATRKGTQQAAATLVKDARFVMNSEHKRRLNTAATLLRDSKLRDLVICGVGYHHAGLDIPDRKAIEGLFTSGDLPVLFSTSTLAMGVNLPAHLVVVKSTSHYVQGMFQEYTESQILQMIGRAGRPQFDTTATAVIMTSHTNKMRYEALLGGKQMIESCLHHNLIEHLNAEIVLHTITDITIALEWLHSTFFYIRVKQNPKYYNFPEQKDKLEGKLQDLLVKDLNLLEKHSLISMEDGFTLKPTDTGRLMARYCVAFKSMERFLGLNGKEELEDLVCVMSQCQEFTDVHLRVMEKRVLNTLNKDKNRATIRFPMAGKIKSKDMKVNCLLQATLGCLPVQEFSLNQDSQKIFRSASRLSKCLVELKMLGSGFTALLNSALLHKCIQSKLWENSKHVARQLEKIGVTISTTLVNAGLTTFDKIHTINPRELELIVNRHPPFGTQIQDAISRLPKYAISLEQGGTYSTHQADLIVSISLINYSLFDGTNSGPPSSPTLGHNHTSILLVGDSSNNIICKQKIRDSQLFGNGKFSRKLTVHRSSGSPDELQIYYISMEYVGLDVHEVFTPRYTGAPPMMRHNGRSHNDTPSSNKPSVGGRMKQSCPREGWRPCNHHCINKDICGHDCCRNGLIIKKQPKTGSNAATPSSSAGTKPRPLPGPDSITKRKRPNAMTSFLDDLHARSKSIPQTPALKRIKPILSTDYSGAYTRGSSDLDTNSLKKQFSYNPNIRAMDHNTTTTTYYSSSRQSQYGPHSELIDQIYDEDSIDGHQKKMESERVPLFKAARQAQTEANNIQREHYNEREDNDMRDFEDYIWEEWERNDDHTHSSHDGGHTHSSHDGGHTHPSHDGGHVHSSHDGGHIHSSHDGGHTRSSHDGGHTRSISSGHDGGHTRSISSGHDGGHTRSISSGHDGGHTRSISSGHDGGHTRSISSGHDGGHTRSISSGHDILNHTNTRPPYVSGDCVSGDCGGGVIQTVPTVVLQPRDTHNHNNKTTCTFFTSGPISGPDDEGSDLFGSVFAGIF